MNNQLNTVEYEVGYNYKLSQEFHVALQNVLLADTENILEPVVEHYFGDGTYTRVGKFPAGSIAVGKAHRTNHTTIVLKGTGLMSNDAGDLVEISAPSIFVVPAGKKKILHSITECWIVNVFATDTQDVDEIEKKVIIPEQEFQLMLGISNETDLRIGV